MYSKYLKAFLSILSLSTIGYADQAVSQSDTSSIIQYHNRVILFGPFHQGYERIKPDAFYVGIEAYLAWIWNRHSWIAIDILANAELRMGYNLFFNGKDHLTPIAGVGFIRNFEKESRRGTIYGTLGFLYNHEFNTIFALGLNAKFLFGASQIKHYTLFHWNHHDDHKHYIKHYHWKSPTVGVDIALPITFRFGYRRHWDYRLEPFYIYLYDSKASDGYFGFRNSLGYRF